MNRKRESVYYLIGNIIDNNDAMSASIVTRRDGSESLLTSRVPNLKLDGLAV